jgi:hypothetical protein
MIQPEVISGDAQNAPFPPEAICKLRFAAIYSSQTMPEFEFSQSEKV